MFKANTSVESGHLQRFSLRWRMFLSTAQMRKVSKPQHDIHLRVFKGCPPLETLDSCEAHISEDKGWILPRPSVARGSSADASGDNGVWVRVTTSWSHILLLCTELWVIEGGVCEPKHIRQIYFWMAVVMLMGSKICAIKLLQDLIVFNVRCYCFYLQFSPNYLYVYIYIYVCVCVCVLKFYLKYVNKFKRN